MSPDDKGIILVVNGPNLNLLGVREPDVYGWTTLNSINQKITEEACAFGYQTDCFQSNHEGDLVDFIQRRGFEARGMLINPAALSMSYLIRDAITAVRIPTVEVHISNIYARESWHHNSCLAACCIGQIVGFGADSYSLALAGLIRALQKQESVE